jgi:hypothetical protein
MAVPDELSFTAVDIEVYGADDNRYRDDPGQYNNPVFGH